MKTHMKSRGGRVLTVAVAILMGVGLAEGAALSASADPGQPRCQGYVNKAGTNQYYSMPSGSLNNPYTCSTGQSSTDIGTVGHMGQDVGLALGTAIPAVATGTVVERGYDYLDSGQTQLGCHGKFVVVQDTQGVFSIYAHLNDVSDSYPVGSHITRGDTIGTAGHSGNPDVCGQPIGDHFELMIAYQWVITTWGGGFHDTTTKFTNPITYIQNHE